MFADIDIFKMSASMASHAGRRQALTAQNMANVDTPGFRAQRIASFAELTDSAEVAPPQKATRAGHFNGSSSMASEARIEEVRDSPALDGNTVTVEREMLESIGAKREHDRALAIYRSALNILHSTLARS